MRNVLNLQMRPLSRLGVLCALVSLIGSTAVAKEYVRWVDENGVVHIGESVPPKYKDKEIETLNDQGVVTGKLPPTPTAEEIARREREAEREAARAALAERQEEYRDNLFKSYATIGDLESFHQSRMDDLYFRQSINDHKVRELRDTLRKLMTQAKEYNFPYSAQSTLPPIPENLLLDLQATNQTLGERQADAETIRRKLLDQERKFESDLEIYRRHASPDALAAQDRRDAAGGGRR